MATLEDLKEKLSYSLTTVSPSFVLSQVKGFSRSSLSSVILNVNEKPQGWEQLFKEFFAKGTRDEVHQLLPKGYQPVTPSLKLQGYQHVTPSLNLARQEITQPSQANCQSFESVPHHETAPTAEQINVQGSTTTQEPHTTTTCPSPSHSPSPISQTNLEKGILGYDSISKPKLNSSTRVSRAIQAMRNAKKRDPGYYDVTWSGSDSFIDHGTVEETAMERYRRIRGLQSRNEDRGDMVKYAQRFSLVIGAQELQVIERGLPSNACSRGTSLRSVAINKLAEFLQVERKQILDENKRRSHYVSIFERLGPGALLLLGEMDGILSL